METVVKEDVGVMVSSTSRVLDHLFLLYFYIYPRYVLASHILEHILLDSLSVFQNCMTSLS